MKNLGLKLFEYYCNAFWAICRVLRESNPRWYEASIAVLSTVMAFDIGALKSILDSVRGIPFDINTPYLVGIMPCVIAWVANMICFYKFRAPDEVINRRATGSMLVFLRLFFIAPFILIFISYLVVPNKAPH